jgi:formylglycine-generating enzyme required for sulfatase activity
MRKILLSCRVLVLLFSLIFSSCSFGSNIENKRKADPTDKIPTPAGMVRVKGGSFQMGTPYLKQPGEPFYITEQQHLVNVGNFFMGKYEVTQEQYLEVMGENPSYFEGENLPVECVSWYKAVEFCRKLSLIEGLEPYYSIDPGSVDPFNTSLDDTLKWSISRNPSANGYRLPSEAEWEYACRAGTVTKYYTGDSISITQARFTSDSTVAVGSYAPNVWGLYDMCGNVWEWCFDWYDRNYHVLPLNNPQGGTNGDSRVIRGGSYYNPEIYLRSAGRNYDTPSKAYIDVGFRLVRPMLPY